MTVTTAITIDQLKQVMPAGLRKSATQELVDKINSVFTDPIFAETLRDNILGYIHVMQDGKFKMEDYINAVRYVSYKLMGDSNIAAYTKTFPDRFQYFIDNGTSEKDIASYVAAYNKNKLVNLILEQTLIPNHVLNADIYQKAINHQLHLMQYAKSEKVQTDAANSLLTHLKPPETSKLEIDVTHKENSAISELRNAVQSLAAQQQLAIQAGVVSAHEVAKSKIIQGECERVDE